MFTQSDHDIDTLAPQKTDLESPSKKHIQSEGL